MKKIARVLLESFDDPYGRISPSVYDTAHVVRAWVRSPARVPAEVGAPALRFLLDARNRDGSWGWSTTPAGYRLVPTLAASIAMCAVLGSAKSLTNRDVVRSALDGALRYLTANRVAFGPDELPDTVAVEYLVPALFEELNERLATIDGRRDPLAELMAPVRMWRDQLSVLRDRVRTGAPIPVQRNHCWELFDSLGVSPPPFRDGSIVCSPAATVAALSLVDFSEPAAVEYLRTSSTVLGGAQPTVLPLTIFERSWLVNAAVAAGVPIARPLRKRIVDGLRPFWTPTGVGAADGLAIEADDTACYLLALMSVGAEVTLDCLLDFEGESAFRTYRNVERNTSVSTNAHVLEALTAGMDRWPHEREWFGGAARKAREFLLSVRSVDGHWTDKWHASPYYATSCAVSALGTVSAETVEWVLDSQRPDGSWGIWCPTLEETCYALGILDHEVDRRVNARRGVAVRKGLDFLEQADAAATNDPVRTPLWHSKEIYSPTRLVEGLTASVRERPRNLATV